MEQERTSVRTAGAVIGENVRRLRRAAGLSQSEVVDRVRGMRLVIHRSRLVELENGGRAEIGLAEMLALAAALRCALKDFFAGEGWVLLHPAELLMSRQQLRAVYGGCPAEEAYFGLLMSGQPGLENPSLVRGTGRQLTSPLAVAISTARSQCAAQGQQFAERLQRPGTQMSQVEWDDLEQMPEVFLPSPLGDEDSAIAALVAHRVGIGVSELSALSKELWGHSFAEEHKARLRAAGHPSGRSRGVAKGHVTRRMQQEIRDAYTAYRGSA